jgi:hypothetical protein
MKVSRRHERSLVGWPAPAAAALDQVDLVEDQDLSAAPPAAWRGSPRLLVEPLRASIRTQTTSASCAPPQADVTMARSSRRFGRKMPGVSTKTICASPSMAMPRISARVVCTLRETIETFEPTSALSSVDLPAFGAPISATKPQRVDGEEDHLGAADDVLERHVADRRLHAAVGRVVAVVAHHEEVARRHGVDVGVVVEAVVDAIQRLV